MEDRCTACDGRGFIPQERECANETCSKRFRWQNDRAGHRGRRDAIYCSTACARAQAARVSRRRQKEKPIIAKSSRLDPEETPTMTVEDAGHWLGISRNTAYAAAKAGQIPTIRLGRRLIVPTAALARILDVPSDLQTSAAQRFG